MFYDKASPCSHSGCCPVNIFTGLRRSGRMVPHKCRGREQQRSYSGCRLYLHVMLFVWYWCPVRVLVCAHSMLHTVFLMPNIPRSLKTPEQCIACVRIQSNTSHQNHILKFTLSENAIKDSKVKCMSSCTWARAILSTN